MSGLLVYNPVCDEYSEKIAKGETMPGKGKYDLQTKIHNILRVEDHEELFKVLVKSNSKYTSNNVGTYFDLNELDSQTLWRLKQLVELSMARVERGKVYARAELEKNEAEARLTKRLLEESAEHRRSSPRSSAPEISTTSQSDCSNQCSTYEQLRTQALYSSMDPQSEGIRARNMLQIQPPTKFGDTMRSNFVSSGLRITDEDLGTETEPTVDDDDNPLERGLEDEDADEDEPTGGDKTAIGHRPLVDPSLMIKNGGRDYDGYNETEDNGTEAETDFNEGEADGDAVTVDEY